MAAAPSRFREERVGVRAHLDMTFLGVLVFIFFALAYGR